MTDEMIIGLASKHADIRTDDRGRIDYEFDTHGLLEFSRLVASHQRDEILTLIKAYGDARYKEWKGDRTSPHYRSTYMEGMSDASDDILSHILKSAAIREQGKE